MKEKICGIYKFTNKFNQKVYIGQSIDINNRFNEHKNNAINGMKGYFYNAIRKYGIDNFDFDILLECTIEELDYWEKFYISYYKSNINRYGRKYGYNMTDGSTEMAGLKMEESSRENTLRIQL